MRERRQRGRMLAVALITVTAAGASRSGAQDGGAAAPPAAPPGICGTMANCAETNDFAAMITNFRTSETRGYKIIDVVVRYRNKTANPLVLAYVQGSGTAVDEKGNRYIVWGPNGVRGMGQVYGQTFDPKFSVPAGGVGEAQYELAWYPGNQIYGFTFQLDLTVDEINSYEGNQHSLGGEFPLHYQGLANGIATGGGLVAGAPVAGGAPGASTPCANGTSGTAAAVAAATGSQAAQNATDKATAAVATATSVASGLKSIFGHKKSQPQNSGDPCGQAATGAATAATNAQSAPAPTAGATAAPAAAASSAASVGPATRATPPSGKSAPVTTTSAGTLAPSAAKAPATTTSTGALAPARTTSAPAAKGVTAPVRKPVVARKPAPKDSTGRKP